MKKIIKKLKTTTQAKTVYRLESIEDIIKHIFFEIEFDNGDKCIPSISELFIHLQISDIKYILEREYFQDELQRFIKSSFKIIYRFSL